MRLPIVLPLAAFLLAAPAAAQFSRGYDWLKAVRDRDGDKVEAAVKANGPIVIGTRDPSTGETALHIVTRGRDLRYLSYLLGRGGDPDVRDNNGQTPLLLATSLGWTEGMSLLLDAGAKPDVANQIGETPLIRAIENRDLAAARLLLQKGANPNKAHTGSGLSARDYAARDPRAAAILREIDAKQAGRKATYGPN